MLNCTNYVINTDFTMASLTKHSLRILFYKNLYLQCISTPETPQQELTAPHQQCLVNRKRTKIDCGLTNEAVYNLCIATWHFSSRAAFKHIIVTSVTILAPVIFNYMLIKSIVSPRME